VVTVGLRYAWALRPPAAAAAAAAPASSPAPASSAAPRPLPRRRPPPVRPLRPVQASELGNSSVYFPFDQSVLTPERRVVTQAATYAKSARRRGLSRRSHDSSAAPSTTKACLSAVEVRGRRHGLGGVAQSTLQVDGRAKLNSRFPPRRCKEPLNRRATVSVQLLKRTV